MAKTPVFELPSAKNLSCAKVVGTFVPTDLYWAVLGSDQHDVIFGTRGSGKTMLLRMMSVDNLRAFAEHDDRATGCLYHAHRFGIYLATGIDWCVAFEPKGADTSGLFVNGMNLVACEALVDALESLLSAAVVLQDSDSHEAELRLVDMLTELWFRHRPQRCISFLSLKLQLAAQQKILRDLWKDRIAPDTRQEEAADYFFRADDLFGPVDSALTFVNAEFGLPKGHRWLLCLDELEVLNPAQLRLVASTIRGTLRHLALKIATQPYTLDLTETNFGSESEKVSAVDFRDFQIRRLQYDPQQPEYRHLAAAILKKRVGSSVEAERLAVDLFGNPTLRERALAADAKSFEESLRALEAQPSVAVQPLPEIGPGDQTAGPNIDQNRKKIPVLAMRVLKRAAEGHQRPKAYWGWLTIVALSDGNPGFFVRLLNDMGVRHGTQQVSAEDQHRVAVEMASVWHEWSQALYSDGNVLHDLIESIGRDLERRLHSKRESEWDVQEEFGRFVVDLRDLEPRIAVAFKVGARHALLVSETRDSSVRYPATEGVWRLSYGLYPKFWLIPRKGRVFRYKEGQLPLRFDQVADGTTTVVEPGDRGEMLSDQDDTWEV